MITLTNEETNRFTEWLRYIINDDVVLAAEHGSKGGLCSIAEASELMNASGGRYVLARLTSLTEGT